MKIIKTLLLMGVLFVTATIFSPTQARSNQGWTVYPNYKYCPQVVGSGCTPRVIGWMRCRTINNNTTCEKLWAKPQVGHRLYSTYLKSYITVKRIVSDDLWYFERNGRTYEAGTELSYWYVIK